METTNAASLQTQLVNVLKSKKHIKSESVENAFLKVPRHLFLPDTELTKVYSDVVIGTKTADNGITISSSSQPAIMAVMLEQLCLKPGDKVLEIGAGTGFNAALMAEIVGKTGYVVSMDIDKDITDFAERAVNVAGYKNVTIVCRDGFGGYQELAPYDKIILTVAAWDISPNWINQLKPNGNLLLPLSFRITQKSICFKKINHHLESRSISNCGFMNWRGEHAMPSLEQVLINKEMFISTFSTTNELVDTAKTINLLSNPREEFNTGIKATENEVRSSLYNWIEIRKPNVCRLFATEEFSQKLGLNLFPFSKELRSSAGLINDDSISLLIPGSESNSPGFDVKTSSVEICVKQFSENSTPSKELVELVIEWDKSGRPTADEVEVKVIPINQDYELNHNEIIVEKRWTKLVINWRNLNGTQN